MDGEEFYQEFKNALDYLGVSWGEKEKVQVWVADGLLWLRHGPRTVRLEINVGSTANGGSNEN